MTKKGAKWQRELLRDDRRGERKPWSKKKGTSLHSKLGALWRNSKAIRDDLASTVDALNTCQTALSASLDWPGLSANQRAISEEIRLSIWDLAMAKRLTALKYGTANNTSAQNK